MKQAIRLFMLGLFMSFAGIMQGQIVINEVQYVGTDRVELQNVGTTMVNVSNWWICHLFSYAQFSSLTVSGNLNMAPGDIIVISGFSLNNSASDFGIYNSSSFSSATAMQDFVQWGAGGLGRESVAVNKGIWTAGDFVPTVAGGSSSIEFDGCSMGSGAWSEQTTPTFGSANATAVAVDGGTVATSTGADTAYYCIAGMGGGPGLISFDSTTTSTESYAYVVTDASGIILGLPPGDMVDFAPAGPGECWVWGLSYSGNVTAQVGDDATQVALSDGCFELSSNFVVVFRDSVDGGTVTSAGGMDTVQVCLNDPASGMVSFDSANTAGPNFAYVVTDASGTILGLPPGDMVNFTPAGPGECWVWGLSYSGNITAQLGDNATTTALTDGCYDLSDDFVVVFRDSVDGGTITEVSGQDTIYYCISGTGGGTGITQYDSVNAFGANFAYVVTDNNGTILALPPGDMVDVTGAPIGECWVWGLSYTGTVTAQPGDNATQVALSDGCFDLSDNFIVLFRDSVDGGDVLTEGGMDTVQVCINDPSASVISFDSTNVAGPNFAYVVTDNAGTILGLPPGDMVDFSGAGIGECWVWGLSYSGNILAQVGDNASSTTLTDGCYDLSDEFVVVFRDSVAGGTVQTNFGEDTVYYCIAGNGGGNGVVEIDNFATSGPNYTLVVTDPSGVIVGLPPADMVDVTAAGIGECWVWGLSYSGALTAQPGDNATQIALSDGCFDLSDNFVVIFRDSVDGGGVLTTMGNDSVEVCINDPASSVISFESANAFGPNFRYVVTDDAGTILGLPPGNMVDFSGAGIGTCLVWGLSYSGDVLAQVGDPAMGTTLTTGCFDLSDDPVYVFRDSVDGGSVTTDAGADTVYVCLTDTGETAGILNFASQDAFGSEFRYVVTDPTTKILGLPPGNSVNFIGAGVGECWVWGLSYNGNLTANLDDIASQTALSDGCFDLSDEFVVVFRDTTAAACGTTSIQDELKLENLSVFPNPTNSLLQVSFSTPTNSSRETNISIYNTAGQEILQQSRTAQPGSTQELTLQVSDLSNGVYLLLIQNGDRISSQRFLKE